MITTSELTAHIEGTFTARLEIAQEVYNRDPNTENSIRLEEAERTYNTLYGILYQFDASNEESNNQSNTGR